MRSASRIALTDSNRVDRPGLAVACICLAVFFATTMDSVAKFLSGSYPVQELLLVRSLTAAPFLLVFVWWRVGLKALRCGCYGYILARAVAMFSAYLGFVLAIAAMPIADAISLYFTQPLIVAVLAGPVLGERVPWYRWVAIVLGFIGVLIMIRPGSAVFEPAALLALYSAIGYGVGQLITRSLPAPVRPVVLACHQNMLYLVFTLALAFAMSFVPAEAAHPSVAFLVRDWVMPPPRDLGLMILTGVMTSFAMLLFVTAYRSAEVNFVAPFEYSSMFWAVLYGIILFGDIPGPATATGAVLIAGAGLFVLYMGKRRRARARAAAPTA